MVTQAQNSATQIKKCASCIRLWGWEYLEGLKPPSGAAAELGNRCHKVLEAWLSVGVAPDPATREGKIVIPGLVYLPQPSPHLETEREFAFELHGHHYRGFVDLGYWSKDGLWVVHDHKTTSDFMWALTEEELPHDVQAILYAKEAMDRHKVDKVLLSWLYMCTRGKPKAEPRLTVIERPIVESGMKVIEHYTNHMAELRQKHLPIVRDRPHQPGEDSIVLTLEPNAYACGDYKGCAFMDRCKLTSREKMRSIMAKDGKKQTLRERMAMRKAARSGDAAPDAALTAAPTPAVNPPEQPPVEEQTQPLTAEEKKEAGKGKKGTTTDAEKTTRGRGRTKGTTKKGDSVEVAQAVAHEVSFVKIWTRAIMSGGEERHMAAAEKAWSLYKQEFMDDV